MEFTTEATERFTSSPVTTDNLFGTTDFTSTLGPFNSTYTNTSWSYFNTTIPPEQEGHSTVAIVLIALVAFILMVSTVGGNLLVIIAYHTNRRLRSVNNLFLVSLACSDLVIGLVSMNLYPVMIILKRWYLGEVACDIWLCIDYTLSMASVANLMLICLDRYFSVICPFTYRPKRTRPIAKVAIILAWFISMLLWAPAIIIWPRIHERTVGPDECQIQFFENPIITSVTAFLAFYLPVLIMIILYWKIYRETKRCRDYMDYLRSYKTVSQQTSSKSPFTRRKSKAQSNNIKPRNRLNSSPATVGFSTTSKVWKPDPLVENPIEVTESPSTAQEHKENSRADDEIENVEGPQTTSQLLNENINNNLKDRQGENSSRKGSRLQRFLPRSILGSIRNSVKSSGAECHSRDKPNDSSANDLRKDITLSVCNNANTHQRSSSDTGNANEKFNLLVSEEANGVTNSRANQCGVPAISINDRADEAPFRSKQHKIARRSKSETDGLVRSGSLTGPFARTKPLPRSESAGGESTRASSRIPSSDRKAARTLSAILLAFVVTWLPYNVCVLYSSFCKVQECNNTIPGAVWEIAYYLCYINSTLNPFCYAACNRTFRDTFIRLLTCRKRGAPPSRFKCWSFGKQQNREKQIDTALTQPSTSSSRSVPPSPYLRKRESSNT